MRHGVLRNLSFASRSQPPFRERAEPHLLPVNAPLPFRRPAEPNPGILSAARDSAPEPVITPVIGAADRRPLVPSNPEPSSLRYLAIVGCIVFAIAGIGSAGFLLFTAPTPETATVTGPAPTPAPSTLPQSDRAAAPALAETATPPAAAAIPAPPVAPRGAAEGTAPKPSSDVVPRLTPAPTSKRPLVPAVASPARSARPARETSAANGVADRHDVTTRAAPHDRRTPAAPAEAAHDRPATTSAEHRHGARAHVAERRAHSPPDREIRSSSELRSARPAPVRAPKQPTHPTVAAAPQQADQAAEFDQLLAHLTGSANSVGSPSGRSSNEAPSQSLTPPPAGAPDPFAPLRPAGVSAQ
jgi:hypothetical protein